MTRYRLTREKATALALADEIDPDMKETDD